jgi:hypothetical protein
MPGGAVIRDETMDNDLWTPLQVFIYTYIASGVTGLVPLLRSKEPLGLRNVLLSILFYGAAGMGLGVIAYEYLGGKEKPWLIIACGMLVGIGVIRMSDIAAVARRVLGVYNGGDKKQ